MNERAKQLALQALKHPDNDNDGLTVFDNDELEKFAELIVKECVSKALQGQLTNMNGNQIAYIIKEHFGVK